MLARTLSLLTVVVLGLVLGVVVIEIGLRLVALRPDERESAGDYRRMHYIYTETGLGKCYPSDPHGYLPYRLNDDSDGDGLGAIIADVADVPDTWSLERKIDFLRRKAPYCNNIELVALNEGPRAERAGRAMIIGDSFAFGEGLRLDDSLGWAMAERFPDFNFPNMAWPGSSIDTIFDVAKAPGDIDAVLYFYNINDIARTEALIHRRDQLHDTLRGSRWAGRDVAGLGAPRLCEYSRLCWMLQLRSWEAERSRDSIAYYRDLYFGDDNREPRARTFDRIAAMRDILEERSIDFAVIMFPLYYKPPFGEYPFEDIHTRVGEELTRRGVEFIDLLPAFDSYSTWYRFTVHPLDRHPSPEALDVAAEYLADRLALAPRSD